MPVDRVGEELNTARLCQLQQSIAMNPLTEEFAFRRKQNWLQRGASRFTAASISYLPPSPDMLPALMADFLDIANRQDGDTVSPLVIANLLSFAFVFLHPFMDGNGRVSRFLLHQQLCRLKVLKNGLILPVSVEMKQHETQYLNALLQPRPVPRPSFFSDLLDSHQVAYPSEQYARNIDRVIYVPGLGGQDAGQTSAEPAADVFAGMKFFCQ